MRSALPLVVAAGLEGACAAQPPNAMGGATAAVDSTAVVEDLRFLASPQLGGRQAGTMGNQRAREYIIESLQAANVGPLGDSWEHPFPLPTAGAEGAGTGTNVLGFVRGRNRPGRFIVVSAHYDHLGTRDGAVYPGADDNASGTAGLLEIARYFGRNPPRHSIIFAAFDAEESGLRGARAFVSAPPVSLDSIALNVNLDMIGRNERRELYVAGLHHYPFLTAIIEEVREVSEIRVIPGHDDPRLGPNDWTSQSDHGAFHEKRIPFLYFGVEDHPDYHRPTDTFDRIDPSFFIDAVEAVLTTVRLADDEL